MLAALRQRIRRFVAAPRGSRFRMYHERLQRRPNVMRTLLASGLGLLLLAFGLIMLVLPGPGLLVATIGAVLIAGESLLVARLLDRIDLAIAGLLRRRGR